MNCRELDRWLDRGLPEDQSPAAREHAARCVRCALALRAAQDVDAVLAGTHESAPPGFLDRVMQRVAAEPQRPVPGAIPMPPSAPMPWWVQAAADPATALACVLAALVVTRIEWLASLSRTLARAGGAFVVAPPMPERPALLIAFWMMAVPALAWASLLLYRWSERLWRRTAGA